MDGFKRLKRLVFLAEYFFNRIFWRILAVAGLMAASEAVCIFIYAGMDYNSAFMPFERILEASYAPAIFIAGMAAAFWVLIQDYTLMLGTPKSIYLIKTLPMPSWQKRIAIVFSGVTGILIIPAIQNILILACYGPVMKLAASRTADYAAAEGIPLSELTAIEGGLYMAYARSAFLKASNLFNSRIGLFGILIAVICVEGIYTTVYSREEKSIYSMASIMIWVVFMIFQYYILCRGGNGEEVNRFYIVILIALALVTLFAFLYDRRGGA